ncbi:hypothetical protein [Pseudomonas putida]|uniref:Uncharacterized protein n=1 Tax=Pseudomonas putida TaxID=303 RepID=A0A8I1ECQ4_PSEPU|nr:hypothetical protein [Pseudomonas putida]MBI6882947.1 hypothetical protein [Pseudomonas putida]
MNSHLTTTNAKNLPDNFQEVADRLKAIKAQVDGLQKTLPAVHTTQDLTTESARQAVLKAKINLEELELKHDEKLALDMVDVRMHDGLREVAEARKAVGSLYVEIDEVRQYLKPTIKALRGKASDSVLADIETLHDEAKEVQNEILRMDYKMPELGMSFAEWNELDKDEKRGLRSAGRPSATLEALIIQARRDLHDAVATVNRLTCGEIRTVEDAIDGIELSKRGRPQISELGKADRALTQLQKRLNVVSTTPSKMRDKKIARLTAQINELNAEIADAEAELTDVELAKRDLEKLRAKHRDLVVAEVDASGENQSALLMAIIRNEDAQQTTVEKILALDPAARVTVTHKVNPKETRLRFERLRMNGQLKAAELEELDRLEHRQDTFAYSRNR